MHGGMDAIDDDEDEGVVVRERVNMGTVGGGAAAN